MPDNLRRAHERNDEVLERIYIGRRFRNDTERLEKLFELYAKMIAAKPAAGASKAKRKNKPHETYNQSHRQNVDDPLRRRTALRRLS